MKPPTEDCPVEGCVRKVRKGHWICTPCWRSVPYQLRVQLTDARRESQAAKLLTDDVAQAMEAQAAFDTYKAARDDCILEADPEFTGRK